MVMESVFATALLIGSTPRRWPATISSACTATTRQRYESRRNAQVKCCERRGPRLRACATSR